MINSETLKRFSDEVYRRMSKAERRLFLLDFDGTLIDFSSHFQDALPPEDLILLLNDLAALPGMKVVIITGRSRISIGHLLDNIKIDVVAEHGAIIRESGIWRVISNGKSDWKEHLFPVLNKYSQLLPGTFPEEKEFSLAWHYRNLPPIVGRKYCKALKEELAGFSSLFDLRIIDGKKVVEIMSGEINKGTAVEYLTGKSTFDYILSIGDDKTDEDMFSALSGKINADTIKIGKGRSVAMYNLSDVEQVRLLLRHLLNEMVKRLN